MAEDGFSLEQGPERLDDGLTPLEAAVIDEAPITTPSLSTSGGEPQPPAQGSSFWPKLGFVLLIGFLIWSAYLAATTPSRERPAPDEQWTPSSGLCEGLSPLECKWN